MFLSVYNCFIYVYSILGHMVCLWFMIVKKKIMWLRRGAKWFDSPAVLLGEEIPIFHGTLEELAVLGQLWFQHCGLWKWSKYVEICRMLGLVCCELTNHCTLILLHWNSSGNPQKNPIHQHPIDHSRPQTDHAEPRLQRSRDRATSLPGTVKTDWFGESMGSIIPETINGWYKSYNHL